MTSTTFHGRIEESHFYLRVLCLVICPNYLMMQYLGGNDVHTLPSLSGLSKLGGNGCIYLHTIRDLPTSLKFLYAVDCPTLETMPNFSEMSNMRKLEASDSPKFT
ncbi:hypothetical protein ACFX15_025643 [Malus domestica]